MTPERDPLADATFAGRLYLFLLALIKSKLMNRLRWKPRTLFDDLED